jgi:putative membrane protein
MLNRIKFPLISAILTLMSFQAHAQGYPDRSGDWHSNWGWGHILFGSSMMVLFWGGIILVIVLVVRAIGSGSAGGSGTSSAGKMPLDILNDRFARGEIDKEEYQERKNLLSG